MRRPNGGCRSDDRGVQVGMDENMRRSIGSRRAFVVGTMGLMLASCRPGLGAQLASRDYAHTFTRRDLAAVHALSTESFRRAVWNRLSPQEFQPIARLMGHGRHMDVVDTLFDGDRAAIQMRTEDKKQFRLHAVRVGEEWLVDDVLAEVEPAVYVSKRRQAEAVLAIRDFRLALEAKDGQALAQACSQGFAQEVWSRMTAPRWQQLGDRLAAIVEETAGEAGDVRTSAEGSPSAPVGQGPYVFYFTSERGRLVVDDVHLPKGPPTMRVRLRNELAK